MKKFLSWICAAALLCAALLTGAVFAAAEDGTTVLSPAVAEEDAPAVGTVGASSADPNDIYTGSQIAESAAPLDTGFSMRLPVINDDAYGHCSYKGFSLKTALPLAGYAGVVLYVAPDGDDAYAFHYDMTVRAADGSESRWWSHFLGDVAYFLRADGDGGWTEIAGNYYGDHMPGGNAGWLYIPFSGLNASASGSRPAADATVTQIMIMDPATQGASAALTLTVGAPMAVAKDQLDAATGLPYTTLSLPQPPAPEDTTPPTFAGDVRVTQRSAFSLSLSWTAASDDVTAPEALTYRIYAAGSDFGGTLSGAPVATVTGTTSAQLTGLAPNTAYYLAVAVYDEAGNGTVWFAAEPVTTEKAVVSMHYADLSGCTHMEGSAADDHEKRCPALGTLTVDGKEVPGFTGKTQGGENDMYWSGDAYAVDVASVNDYAGVKFYIRGGETSFRFSFALKNDGVRKYPQVNGACKLLPAGAKNWTSAPMRYYGPQIPADFTGWVYVPFSSLDITGGLIDGFEIWSPGVVTGRVLEGQEIYRPDLVDRDGVEVSWSAPMFVPKNYVDRRGDPTDEPIDPDAPIAPDAPALPGYTGEKVAYADGITVASVKLPTPRHRLTIADPIPTDLWTDAVYTQLVTSKTPIMRLPMFSSFKETGEKDSVAPELIGSYYIRNAVDDVLSPIGTDGGKAFMFYIEVPDNDEEVEVKINNAFVKDGQWINAFIYNGTVQVMATSETVWSTLPVSAYYFSLPSGFRGMVRVPYSAYVTTDGEPVDETYELSSMNLFIPNLIGGEQSVIVSAPMIVTELGNSGRAVYLDGDTTVARDLFTGEPLTVQQVKKEIAVGDLFDTLPDATLTQKVTHGEVGSTVVPKWEKLDGAVRYQIELYNKTFVDGQAKYLLQALYSTYGQTRQLLTGILPQEDYVIVVRAYDGQGTLLGIYGHDAFSTKENGTDQPDPNDPLIPTDPDDGRTDGRDDVPKTGVEVPLGAVAALAVSVAAVPIAQRKKKTR